MNAVATEDEARPEDHVLATRRLQVLLHLPLRAVVRDDVLRRRAGAERAHQDDALDALLVRRREEVAEAFRHDAMEVMRAALDDRDEVHHVRAALHRRADARGVGDVAGRKLDPPARELRPLRRRAHECTDVPVLCAERVDDLRADEARSARDEDFQRAASDVKFCQ
jgi:hypothetical protein